MSQDAERQEFPHLPSWVLPIFHSEFADGLASLTITVFRAFSLSSLALFLFPRDFPAASPECGQIVS